MNPGTQDYKRPRTEEKPATVVVRSMGDRNLNAELRNKVSVKVQSGVQGVPKPIEDFCFDSGATQTAANAATFPHEGMQVVSYKPDRTVTLADNKTVYQVMKIVESNILATVNNEQRAAKHQKINLVNGPPEMKSVIIGLPALKEMNLVAKDFFPA
jgi:hypothetical protein